MPGARQVDSGGDGGLPAFLDVRPDDDGVFEHPIFVNRERFSQNIFLVLNEIDSAAQFWIVLSFRDVEVAFDPCY